jgi:hypothetical protein
MHSRARYDAPSAATLPPRQFRKQVGVLDCMGKKKKGMTCDNINYTDSSYGKSRRTSTAGGF